MATEEAADRWLRDICAVASLAYAAGMKRLGHDYYVCLVIAVWTSTQSARVVYSGPMPRQLTTASVLARTPAI